MRPEQIESSLTLISNCAKKWRWCRLSSKLKSVSPTCFSVEVSWALRSPVLLLTPSRTCLDTTVSVSATAPPTTPRCVHSGTTNAETEAFLSELKEEIEVLLHNLKASKNKTQELLLHLSTSETESKENYEKLQADAQRG
ncbi:Uncharacterized protein Rs2_30899 [Raphanus sativus]|nr:Uncharacterized protein Rs2_30899 [Raphanus sativus]